MEVVKEKVMTETKSELQDEEIEEEKTLEGSIVPKNEFHVEEEQLKNGTRGETNLVQI